MKSTTGTFATAFVALGGGLGLGPLKGQRNERRWYLDVAAQAQRRLLFKAWYRSNKNEAEAIQ